MTDKLSRPLQQVNVVYSSWRHGADRRRKGRPASVRPAPDGRTGTCLSSTQDIGRYALVAPRSSSPGAGGALAACISAGRGLAVVVGIGDKVPIGVFVGGT